MSQQEGLHVKRNWLFQTTIVSTFLCLLSFLYWQVIVWWSYRSGQSTGSSSLRPWVKLPAFHFLNKSLGHWYLLLNMQCNWIYHWWVVYILVWAVLRPLCVLTWYNSCSTCCNMNNPSLVLPPHAEPDPQFRDRTLTPVMSGQVRELTAKMLIPSTRIRLMDMLGHGKFT